MADEIHLRVESLRALIDWGVPAVGLQLAGFRIVAEIRLEQHVSQVSLQLRITDWRNNFDAMFQISRHPVGAADVHLIVAAI